MYVPILKWRQGEYLALERLEDDIKDGVQPLIEVPPVEWDFERSRLAKTIDQHLEKFPHRFHSKWKGRSALIDLALLDPAHRMADGRHPALYIFNGIRDYGENAVPVTGLNRDNAYQEAIKNIAAIDKNGLCIRLNFEDIVKSDIEVLLEALSAYHNLDFGSIDLVLDLESPNFDPIDKFYNALFLALKRFKRLPECRTFTIAGTSFPKTMAELKKGIQIIERPEWLLYREFLANAPDLQITPQFGDYAIAHPSLPEQDMRLLKPAASLRYTIDNAWYIDKGSSVRDHGFEQYVNICNSLVGSSYFLGADFSSGDRHILECSQRKVSTGNLSVWRWVGTNHHITKVATDLANSL